MTTNGRNYDRLYRLVIALQLGVILLVTTAYGGDHRRVLQWNEFGNRLKAGMARCQDADPTERPAWYGDWCSRMNRTSTNRPIELIDTYHRNQEITWSFASSKFDSLYFRCQRLAKEREAMDTGLRYAEMRAHMWEERAHQAERRLKRTETKRERAGSTP